MALNSFTPLTPTTTVPEYVRVISVKDMNGKEKRLFIPASLELNRPKRPRTTFTTQQLQILEMEFQQNHFITEIKRKSLAEILNLTQTQIKIWFQNRRTKYRRQQQLNSQQQNHCKMENVEVFDRNMKMNEYEHQATYIQEAEAAYQPPPHPMTTYNNYCSSFNG